MAVALLDLGCRDHHFVAEGGDRPLRLRGHEPLRAGERAGGLERQRRLALVADEHEHIGRRRREHGLERVDPLAGRLGGVERRAAADGRDASVRQPRTGRHLGQPLGLRRDRLPHLLARHGCLYTMAGDGGLRAHLAVERATGADRADAARAVGLLLRHARRRLTLRDGRDERDRALRRAHVLQGDGAAADRARHRRRDRCDRGRVQRLHRQGVHGLLRPLRRRDARHGARRPRRHAPQLPVRPGGDRAREGRDHRGDEHVLRHAARLHRRRLRDAPLRRPAARLGHHRPQGDGPRRDAADVPRLHEHLVPARPDGRRHRRPARRRSPRPARGAARRPAVGGDGVGRAVAAARQRARQGAHEAVGSGAPRPRRPQPPARRSRPLRAPAARDRARRRDVVAPLHRGARAPRARLLRLRHEPRLHRRRLALRPVRRRHQPDRRRRDDDRRAVPAPRLGGGAVRRAREGAQLRQGPLRAPAREPARDDHVRPPPRGARGPSGGAAGRARRARRGHGGGHPAGRPGDRRGRAVPRGDRAVRRRRAVREAAG